MTENEIGETEVGEGRRILLRDGSEDSGEAGLILGTFPVYSAGSAKEKDVIASR